MFEVRGRAGEDPFGKVPHMVAHPIIGYLRVSTTGQVDGWGLDVQRTAIEDWAAPHGGVDYWFEDAATGKASGADPVGESIANRPGLAEALLAIEGKGTLVVAHVDRLSRDAIAQELLLRLVRSKGGHIIPVSAPDWGDNDGEPIRDLIRTILGGVAQYERAMIVARLAAGRRAKRKAGGHGGGPLGWGQEVRDGKIVTADWALPIVAHIRTQREAGATYAQIAADLNDQGVPTVQGARWAPRQVQRAIERHLPDLVHINATRRLRQTGQTKQTPVRSVHQTANLVVGELPQPAPVAEHE